MSIIKNLFNQNIYIFFYINQIKSIKILFVYLAYLLQIFNYE